MSLYILSVLKTDFTFKKLLYKHIFTHFTQNYNHLNKLKGYLSGKGKEKLITSFVVG